MVIREMSREECLRVLTGGRLARLACARENQPYIVPVYLAYDEESEYLYGFTTLGQKVAWMRANPLVCVEMDEVAAYDQWMSVIVTGRYEELSKTPGGDDARLRVQERPRLVDEATPADFADSRNQECDDESGDDERERAWQVLKTHPEWDKPGYAAWVSRAHRDSAEPFIPVYYRIRIGSITGHQATRDATSSAVPSPRCVKGLAVQDAKHGFSGRSKVAGLASRQASHPCWSG